MKRTPLTRRTPLRRWSRRSKAHQDAMRALRPQVFSRDGHQCQARLDDLCTGRAEHAHHLLPRSAGGQDALANLLTVCGVCHDAIHHRKPAEARKRGLLRSRYGRRVA